MHRFRSGISVQSLIITQHTSVCGFVGHPQLSLGHTQLGQVHYTLTITQESNLLFDSNLPPSDPQITRVRRNHAPNKSCGHNHEKSVLSLGNQDIAQGQQSISGYGL